MLVHLDIYFSRFTYSRLSHVGCSACGRPFKDASASQGSVGVCAAKSQPAGSSTSPSLRRLLLSLRMTISVRPQVQQVLVSTIHLVEREVYKRALGGTQTTTATPGPINAQQTTTSAPSPSSTGTMSGNGGTSSPLLFFVALGFGVVFTNLW